MGLRRFPAGRRTNLALLVLLGVVLLTGALAFAIGAGWGRWVAIGHGVAGLAIVLLGLAFLLRFLPPRRPEP